MPATAVHQGVLKDPADPGSIRTKGRLGGGRQTRLDLAEVLQHPRTGPVQVGAVLENDVDETVAEEGEAAHRLRPGHRQHGGGQWIGNLVLDDLRRLSRIGGADDHLDVGEVRQGIDGRALHRPDPPGGDEQRGQQDQEAVGHRPANQLGDHGCSPTFSRRSTSNPASVWRTAKRTLSPALMPTISAGSAKGKVMVMPGMPRALNGP
ncbi:hypothetical protein D3C84_151100 [compost metagenome]